MRIIFTFLLMAMGLSATSLAQLNKAAFPFSYLNTNIKSLSLGNATVSLNGIGNEEINPAVAAQEGVLQIIPIWDLYIGRYRLLFKQRGLSTNYRFSNSTVGLSIHLNKVRLSTGHAFSAPYLYKVPNDEIYIRSNYSYSFQSGVTLGAGLNYLYSSEAPRSQISTQKIKKTHSFSIDLGAKYQLQNIQVGMFSFEPHMGLALTDFGRPAHYIYEDSKFPLPTVLRMGGAANIELDKRVYGLNLIELTAVQNVSKIMARMKDQPDEYGHRNEAMNPFKALIKSWGTYKYRIRSGMMKHNLSEQLWWHSGVELKLLEALNIRWGYQKAGEAEKSLSYWALGGGIDLYYLVFDYTYLNNKEEDLLEGHHWQITGRIPLDGTRSDTILNALFN
ncbi:hypothetical protein [Gracilimonas mengyeensis]|uniref:Long-chain fatty acid transport protein n=1 Tax=Gracilimonas mengyeensis TaxID=1302730 RepID=A0A521F217_9BACT|nr:hypothetical protein [Gracilimonas mengyeensis]SMO89671.1 hypothetical protein SAMN06265219_11489 [Gracilimonas mengyeensis]